MPGLLLNTLSAAKSGSLCCRGPLSTPYAASFLATRVSRPFEQYAGIARLHTTRVVLQKSNEPGRSGQDKPTSRRRLSDVLESAKQSRSSRSPRLEVAPRDYGKAPASSQHSSKPKFQREKLPHEGSADFSSRRATTRDSGWSSEDRLERRKSRLEADLDRRPGRWNTERSKDYERRPSHSHSSSSSRKMLQEVENQQRTLFSGGTLLDEFDHPSTLETNPLSSSIPQPDTSSLPTKFSSPTLLPGFVSALEESLGPNVKPTSIQALSLKWLFDNKAESSGEDTKQKWKQFLLASETGSGKSIAYLLPLLQALKVSEKPAPTRTSDSETTPEHAPRALILAPTHELARQLSGFAKSLLHDVKLRVICASRANAKNRDHGGFASETPTNEVSGSNTTAPTFPVDVMVGTPVRLMEMIRGRGWDWERASEKEMRLQDEQQSRDPWDTNEPKSVKKLPNRQRTTHKELALENVEWVIVDEADVLFDPDFQETTRQLLADISAARGVPISTTSSSPVSYPFNFVITSATIPTSLSTYLSTHHPDLIRLASPRLHRLPKTLKTEYVAWTHGAGSNARWKDVERQIREVWQDDVKESAFQAQGSQSTTQAKLSKVLVFVNKSDKVGELGEYLDGKGIKTVALSGKSEERKKGSNHHLDGFLREHGRRRSPRQGPDSSSSTSKASLDPNQTPHVLITTSLLSRGLDFSPDIKNVFIVDEPRNMIDFLHRAGRTGRAGEKGRVVIFGKMKGRGSQRSEEVKKRVGVLSSSGAGRRKMAV